MGTGAIQGPKPRFSGLTREQDTQRRHGANQKQSAFEPYAARTPRLSPGTGAVVPIHAVQKAVHDLALFLRLSLMNHTDHCELLS